MTISNVNFGAFCCTDKVVEGEGDWEGKVKVGICTVRDRNMCKIGIYAKSAKNENIQPAPEKQYQCYKKGCISFLYLEWT